MPLTLEELGAHILLQQVQLPGDSRLDQIQQLGGQMRGELNIAAVPVAMMLLIPETLRTFSRAYPDIRLRVSEELFVEQLQKLRNGQVDLVVGGIPDGLPSGEFIAEELMTTSMVVVARRGSPHARARHLSELSQASWVYTGTSAQTGYASRLFESHGLSAPPVGAMVNSTLALLDPPNVPPLTCIVTLCGDAAPALQRYGASAGSSALRLAVGARSRWRIGDEADLGGAGVQPALRGAGVPRGGAGAAAYFDDVSVQRGSAAGEVERAGRC